MNIKYNIHANYTHVHIPIADIQDGCCRQNKQHKTKPRFINNLWQHQLKNEFCDFTLTTIITLPYNVNYVNYNHKLCMFNKNKAVHSN